MVSTVAPAPSRAATAWSTSVSVNVVESTVRSLRSSSAIHSSGADDPFVVLRPGRPRRTRWRAEPPHLVDADRVRGRQPADQLVGLRRPPAGLVGLDLPAGVEPLPFPFRLVASGGQHRLLLTGRVGRSRRSLPATLRSRRAASRTGRAGPAGCRRSPGRAARAATPPRGCGSARPGTPPGTPRRRPGRAGTGRGGRTPTTSRRLPSTRLAISTCQCSSGSPAR